MTDTSFSTRRNRRHVLGQGVGLALSMPIAWPQRTRSAARAAEPISIALDWYANANHAGVFWAKQEGLFQSAGLDVDIHAPADPTTVLQTVGAGRDTFGISYQPDIMLARAQGVPVVAVASIVPRPLLGIMSLTEDGMSTPADLAGHTVGYPGIPAQEAFLTTMLAGAGLTLDNITLVNVGFNLLPALLSKQVTAVMGAYWTHETIVAERQGYPVSIMKVDEWGVPGYDELVLITSEDYAASSPDLVSAIVESIISGYAAVVTDQTKAIEILLTASPDIDVAVETEGLALLAPVWEAAGANLGRLETSRWKAFSDWMAEHGLIAGDIDVSSALFGDAVIPAATPAP
jgi:putative hydroxymethylpyrimidine transport system substrate-binding protein